MSNDERWPSGDDLPGIDVERVFDHAITVGGHRRVRRRRRRVIVAGALTVLALLPVARALAAPTSSRSKINIVSPPTNGTAASVSSSTSTTSNTMTSSVTEVSTPAATASTTVPAPTTAVLDVAIIGIRIYPDGGSIGNLGQIQLHAQAILSDGSTSAIPLPGVTWSSNDPAAVPVSPEGALGPANRAVFVTITANYRTPDGRVLTATARFGGTTTKQTCETRGGNNTTSIPTTTTTIVLCVG